MNITQSLDSVEAEILAYTFFKKYLFRLKMIKMFLTKNLNFYYYK